jgi:hypothetical protein
MADHPIPPVNPEVLLATAARRLYAAAVAAGHTREGVPALGALQPLTEQALSLSQEDRQALQCTLNSVAYLFELDRLGVELLSVSVALEMDERVLSAALAVTGALVGSLGPRVGALLGLLYPDPRDRLAAARALDEGAPLLRYRLVRLLGESRAPLSGREFCGEPSLLPHLFGGADRLPAELWGQADLVSPDDGAPLPPTPQTPALERLLGLLRLEEVPIKRLHVHPLLRRDALPLSRRIAAAQERPVIALDLRAAEKDVEPAVQLVLRECRLRDGIPLFINPLITDDDEPKARSLDRAALRWRKLLASEKDLVLFATEERESTDLARLERAGIDLADFTIDKTTLQQRRLMFAASLTQQQQQRMGGVAEVSTSPEVSPEQLASIYRVDEGEIRAIVHHAALAAQLRALERGEAAVIQPEDLWKAGREQTRRDISKFATLVQSRYNWDDLVLPDGVKQHLLDFYRSARSRVRVFEDWGYGKKNVRGLGLCAMFYGDSGTGKTMAAEVIANTLNVNMYRIDISTVVSKWLGETERNLNEIFSATEHSDCILFFDEADALFGKRTNVNDAKDRYANVETGYLLQRIESYDGIVILSTNLRSNIDTAFLRRLQFGIYFDAPDVQCRMQIWRKSFPGDAPIARDVSFLKLAQRYETLTGGQIKTVALGAAMLAAYDDQAVSMEHIHRAYINEMEKMQKLVTKEILAGIG